MTEQLRTTRIQGIEVHSIDHIPRDERHGRVKDQGPFWFAGNFEFLSISIGFIGPAMGLSFGWTSLAATLGIVFGTLFMCFHATQGPVLGLPQMVQSRAQFGFRGVLVPLFGTLINYLGFNIVSALLLMSGLGNLFHVPQWITLIATAVISVGLAVYGYDWLHKAAKTLFWVSLPLIGILTLGIIFGMVRHAVPQTPLGFNAVAFGTVFAACASYNIAYAPYVSDYSRYLPHDTGAPAIIWNVFYGAATSATWMIILGAWFVTRLGVSDPLQALAVAGNEFFPGFGYVLAIDSIIILAILVSLGNYSGVLTVITAMDSIRQVRPTRRIRVATTIIFSAVWALVALAWGQGAMNALSLALVIILYLLVPWTAVNLVDFFFIRRGHYTVSELFRPHGLYGNWAWRGLLAYTVGWVAILPFAVLPGLWTGPLASKLGGVDVGWLMGLIVSGASYYAFAKLAPLPDVTTSNISVVATTAAESASSNA